MPINENTTITDIYVSMTNSEALTAEEILVTNGSSRVARISYQSDTVDTSDADFQELDQRVEDGAVVQYNTPYRRAAYRSDQRDDWPDYVRDYIKARDPFERHQSILRQGQTETTNRIWYKRSSAEGGPDLPTGLSDGTIDGIDITVSSVMTDDGWTQDIPSGTDTLYYTRITRSVTGDVVSANGSPPATDQIRYSTDYGETWLTAAPASGLTTVQVNVNGIWLTDTVKEEVVNPFVHYGGHNWQNGGGGADNFNQYISVPDGFEDDYYAAGMVVRKTRSWSVTNEYDYMGNAHMPIDHIRSVTPAEFAASESTSGQVGRDAYLLVQDKRSGACSVGLNDPDINPPDEYSEDFGLMRFVWMTYPKTELAAAVLTALATSITVADSAGMAAGDRLFIGNEIMRISSISSNLDTNGNRLIDVTRAISGTTATTHAEGAVVRAVVNKDAIRYKVITHRWHMPDNTQVLPYGLTKRGIAA